MASATEKEILLGAACFGKDANCSGEAGQESATIPPGVNVIPAAFSASLPGRGQGAE